MFALLLLAAPTWAATPNVVVESDPLIKAVLTSGCYANYKPNPEIVRELFRIEETAGITGEARGILAAAACNESGFTKKAMGDFVDRVTGARCRTRDWKRCKPTSFGMVQQRGWVKKHIRKLGSKSGEPRFDWKIATTYWAQHLVNQIPKVRKECRYKDEIDIWRAAHRTSVVKPKCARWRVSKKTGKQRCAKRIPRCHKIGKRFTSHWKILMRWKHESNGTVDLAQKKENVVPDKFKGYPRAVNP